jgi:hypothetical protein
VGEGKEELHSDHAALDPLVRAALERPRGSRRRET